MPNALASNGVESTPCHQSHRTEPAKSLLSCCLLCPEAAEHTPPPWQTPLARLQEMEMTMAMMMIMMISCCAVCVCFDPGWALSVRVLIMNHLIAEDLPGPTVHQGVDGSRPGLCGRVRAPRSSEGSAGAAVGAWRNTPGSSQHERWLAWARVLANQPGGGGQK